MRYQADQQWLINSPELLRLDHSMSAKALLAGCHVTDSFALEPTHRLGVYFEQLWFHLVATSKDLELAYKNLQIIIDKHTHGEFDSIIKSAEKTIHCELAVKFYLQVGQGVQLSDWVGPNLKDRLDDKYQRLFEHQLALSDKVELKSWLKEKNIRIAEKRLLCKGRLFYPYKKFTQDNFEFPTEVASLHAKGFWVCYQQLNDLLNGSEFQWYQLPRSYWLSEITEIDQNLLPVELNFAGFSLQKIVALKDGKEVMRGFVVNDDWLNKAQQRVLV